MRAALLAAALSTGCVSNFQRHVIHRCPTLTTSLVDFTAGTVALALSALAWNNQREGWAAAYAGTAMATYTLAGMAECPRLSR